MHIDIDGMPAKCFVCGNNNFEALRPRAGEPSDKLACTDCCAEVFYDDLLSPIGRVANRKAPYLPGKWTRERS